MQQQEDKDEDEEENVSDINPMSGNKSQLSYKETQANLATSMPNMQVPVQKLQLQRWRIVESPQWITLWELPK